MTFYIKMFRLMCQSANLVRKIAVYCHPMEEIVEWVRKLWTESHQICKVWALINQILTWCFRSYGLWLKIQIIAQFNISKSIDINQSISIHQFYPIDASNFIRDFLFSHNPTSFSTHVRWVCHSSKWQAGICAVTSWSC